MITLPLVLADLSTERVSVQENRMLADFPGFTGMLKQPGHFIRNFNDWFNDSIGFREQKLSLFYLMTRNRWLNGAMSTEGEFIYLFGEEGHLFLDVQGKLISKFQGMPVFSDEELMSLANKLEEINVSLNRKGIPLIVMFCPDKETVYPEFYPRSIIRGPQPGQLDIITGFLQEHTSAVVFNITEALLAQKENFLLYPKVDHILYAPRDVSHYNEIAAFFGYRELMKHINIFYPWMTAFDLSDVIIEYDEFGQPAVSLKPEKITANKLDSSFFDNVQVFRPFTIENTAYENTIADLPVILFMRDSYGFEYYTEKFVAQHFGISVFIHIREMRHFDQFLAEFQPDIVVFLSVERDLRHIANTIKRSPVLN
jgi:hypothetical protein